MCLLEWEGRGISSCRSPGWRQKGPRVTGADSPVTALKRRPRVRDSCRERQRRAASGTQRWDSKRFGEAEVAATESGSARRRRLRLRGRPSAHCVPLQPRVLSQVPPLKKTHNALSEEKKTCLDTPNDRQTVPPPLWLSVFLQGDGLNFDPSRAQVDQST